MFIAQSKKYFQNESKTQFFLQTIRDTPGAGADLAADFFANYQYVILPDESKYGSEHC